MTICCLSDVERNVSKQTNVAAGAVFRECSFRVSASSDSTKILSFERGQRIVCEGARGGFAYAERLFCVRDNNDNNNKGSSSSSNNNNDSYCNGDNS